MTIAELKEKNITELSRIARSLEIPGASGLRKQDLIFRILQTQSEKEGHIFLRASWKFCLTATAFCAPLITTICPAPTTSMFPRRRFANST